MTESLLSISSLHTDFKIKNGINRPAVNDVSFCLNKGEVVALVGESGSGKSMTALSIMRLVPTPGIISSGTIKFDHLELTALSEKDMQSIRGKKISMVFQEPMTSLNPVLKIGDQLTEPLILHRGMTIKEATNEGIKLLIKVGIVAPQERMKDYPHQLSGGMRQRVMIAMALACSPTLLIADEPTTALDVTIQAQILELLDTLRIETNMGILLITHDLGIVAERAAKTCVMYAGRIVEIASTRTLLETPLHPYTIALLGSLPQNSLPGQPLATILGQPAISGTSSGCDFFERCPQAEHKCTTFVPELSEIKVGHSVRCWKCHD